MMHEREKSDLSTVAVKPANASGRSEGESVERREGAEGNTVEDRTRRTPSRVSVYSGLERVRERVPRRRNGSPLCYTMWMSTCCGWHFPGSSGMRRLGWMG
jgi:hypothetical protein